MVVFLVTINTGSDLYLTAERIIQEVGARPYNAEDEFSVDGIQDPYRAVDESDVVVWLEKLSRDSSLESFDYNPLYGKTVHRRARESGKPLLYYQIVPTGDTEAPKSTEDTREATVVSVSKIEGVLRKELAEIVAVVKSLKS